MPVPIEIRMLATTSVDAARIMSNEGASSPRWACLAVNGLWSNLFVTPLLKRSGRISFTNMAILLKFLTKLLEAA